MPAKEYYPDLYSEVYPDLNRDSIDKEIVIEEIDENGNLSRLPSMENVENEEKILFHSLAGTPITQGTINIVTEGVINAVFSDQQNSMFNRLNLILSSHPEY